MLNRQSKPTMRSLSPKIAGLLILLSTASALSGCGLIADRDRIIVATLDGEPIRRGDLATVIREMPDDERPLIQTKGDLLLTLNKHIDDQIKAALAKELRSEGKIQVDRNEARQIYFRKHPDYRNISQIVDPTFLNMTTGDMKAIEAEIEFGVDDEEELLMREAALMHKLNEVFDSGAVSLSEQEISSKFQSMSKMLSKPEFIEFDAIQFPTIASGGEMAAETRKRIDQGESFDEIAQSFHEMQPGRVIKSSMENNPGVEKYFQFWEQVTGCQPGQIFGPILMPEREQSVTMQNGQQAVQKIPPMFLVLKIVSQTDARPLSLNEARSFIATSLLKSRVMRMLRDEHGVEIFADKLPRPEGFGNQYKDQMIDTSV